MRDLKKHDKLSANRELPNQNEGYDKTKAIKLLCPCSEHMTKEKLKTSNINRLLCERSKTK
jgi:hypothetical protein